MAITFQEPKTGRMQQVGENEIARAKILKRLGWKQVVTAQEEAPAGVVTIEEELEPAQVGDPVLAVTEIPVDAVDPDGDDLSLDLDEAEDAHTESLDAFQVTEVEKPKRKGR